LGDFINGVRNNRTILDLRKLEHLADLVQPRCGKAILGVVADIDAGRRVRL
jgi:hypothetical protein